MKYTFWHSIVFILSLSALTACQEKTKKTSSSSNTGNLDYTTGSSGSGTTSGSTTTTGTSGSTTTTGGSTTGGTSTGGSTTATTGGGDANLPAWKFNVAMSGTQSGWYGGLYPADYDSSTFSTGDFYQLSSQNTFIFKSDTKFHLRVKVLAEPTISSTDNNGKVCYNRTNGSQSSATWPYTKLKFSVAIRDIIYNNGTYSLSNRYATQYVGDAGVTSGEYSQVFKWDKGGFPGRNAATGNDDPNAGALVNGIVGHTVEIYNVQSNAYCRQNYTAYCPFSTHPNTRCWRAELQLATDVTTEAGF